MEISGNDPNRVQPVPIVPKIGGELPKKQPDTENQQSGGENNNPDVTVPKDPNIGGNVDISV